MINYEIQVEADLHTELFKGSVKNLAKKGHFRVSFGALLHSVEFKTEPH